VIKFRPAKEEDIAAFAAISEAEPNAPHWTREHYRDLLARSGEGRALLNVGEAGHELIGFYAVQGLTEQDWELEFISVSPEFRGAGHGSELLAHLIANLPHTCERLFLEVRENNAAARRLYAKQGFAETGRRKRYYRNPVEDAILYERQR
jgi:[ribosomal protein S18]-alanine N-acetyltransferase